MTDFKLSMLRKRDKYILLIYLVLLFIYVTISRVETGYIYIKVYHFLHPTINIGNYSIVLPKSFAIFHPEWFNRTKYPDHKMYLTNRNFGPIIIDYFNNCNPKLIKPVIPNDYVIIDSDSYDRYKLKINRIFFRKKGQDVVQRLYEIKQECIHIECPTYKVNANEIDELLLAISKKNEL